MHKYLRSIVLKRLESLTQKLLSTHNPQVIAVTGSVGKTSTKQAIAHLLSEDYRVLAHDGNYNTEFGLPLSLFELETPSRSTDVIAWLKIFHAMRRIIKSPDYPYEIVVLEMGADKPGDIKHLTSYIKPDIGVVTAVAKVHIEEFKRVEAILEEKWILAQASQRAYYNHDDRRLREQAKGYGHVKGYGLSDSYAWIDLQDFDSKNGWSGMLHIGSKPARVDVPVVAKQSVYGLVVAAAIARKQGLSMEQIAARLSTWQQPSGRMRVLAGKNGSIILDDSYNASPYAVVAALDTLSQFEGKKLAVLGTMNELGDYEEKGHRLVGKHSGLLDALATIGEPANSWLAEESDRAGVEGDNIFRCSGPREAGEHLLPLLEPNTVVLVKGSQNGVFAEEAIKVLLDNPEDADQLVRQSDEWLRQKGELV